MTPSNDASVLHFGLPEKLQANARIFTDLPEQYQQYRLGTAADILFVETPAGNYLSQAIEGEGWRIFRQQGFIREKLRIRPVINTPALILCCMLQGSAGWRLQGQGKLMLIEKEFGLYYIPRQALNLIDLRAGHYDMLSIVMQPEYFRQFVDQHPALEDIYRQRQKHSRRGNLLPPIRMEGTELKLLQELKQQAAPEKLEQLLQHYFQALSPRYVEGGEQVRRLRQICVYIQNHYHQPLSITELSKRAGMHINTFERTFKELLGISPRGYIEHLRMKKAAVLLSQTSLSIKEISNSTGYSGANYFTSVFRKHHRCSPRQYRKNRLS